MNRRRPWLRRGLWASGALAGSLLVAYLIMLGLMRRWVARPPALASEPEIVRLVPEQRGDRVYLGRNWLGRREGLPVLYLTGTPFEMGYANGVLTQKFIHRQEETVLELLHRVAPYAWTRFLVKFFVVYQNRDLPDHFAADLQMEVFGISRGCPDSHPEAGPWFHRVLNYHAAQDISYMLMNSALIRPGCTAFGAWGKHTREGHLLAARNFDWEAAPVFDEDRIVMICEPSDGLAFISLAWAGMVGCVSGMNREGLCVTVNGAPSRLPRQAATPTCLVARDVLQHARNLEEAAAIIRRSRVFVSAQFLVGSRQDGRFVVIEKTPEHTVVREAAGDSLIICANHYMTPALTNDAANQAFVRRDTSVPRYERMAELLARTTAGSLDPVQSAAILRDRRLAGDRFPGNGHRSTLNPLIATHAVILDLTAGMFWAGSPPHQLGRFVAFDLNQVERDLPQSGIGADPLLATGEHRRYRATLGTLDEGWKKLKQRDYASARDCALQAEKDNPGFYRNAWLLAESLRGLGRRQEAARACQDAIEGRPALAGEREQIEKLARAVAEPARLPATAPSSAAGGAR